MDPAALIVTAVIAGIGAYVGSYLKKKGENWATHEDVDKLVKQMAAVTQATKEIEAKISNDLWERQRKAEVKRELLFDVIRELVSFQHAITGVSSTFLAAAADPHRVQQADEWKKLQVDKSHALDKAQLAFEKARALATLVGDSELDEAFLQTTITMNKMALSGLQADSTTVSSTSTELSKHTDQLMNLIRKHLGTLV